MRTLTNWLRTSLLKWLGVDSYGYRLDMLESLLLDEHYRLNGFGALKQPLRDLLAPKE